ncbi:hypothetical protein [Lysobacter enzymogenes]
MGPEGPPTSAAHSAAPGRARLVRDPG